MLVDPPAERERLGDADLGLRVIRHGVQTGDAVLLPPAQQGLVALQPDQGFGSVHPRAQEGGDGGGVAGAGEVQQCGFDRALCVVLLLVLAARLTGAGDLSVLVADEVVQLGLRLPRQGAGGELFDESFVV